MDELDTTVLGLEGAAFQSRLPFTELSPLEKEIFPEVVSADNDTLKTYLLIRNRTLQLWLENPKSELIYEQVIQSSASKDFVSSKYNTLCLKIHRFLSRHGYINFGIFNRIHPIRKVKNCKVVVIGAGMAGLAAARQLASFGIEVVVLEARDRVGGRVATFRKGKYTADLGAMVVTGLGGNPITVISQQIGMEMHKIKQDCPLYETGGKRVSKEKDVLVEQEFNKLLEATSQLSREIGDYEKWKSISLGNAFELVIQVQEKRIKEELISHWTKISDAQSALKRVLTRMVELEQTALRLDSEVKQLTAVSRDSSGEAEKENGKMVLERKMEEWRAACDEYDGLAEKRATHEADVSELERTQPSDVYLSSSDRQLLDWHLANLEFANASPLDKLSLHHWNQDDAYEFSGSHLAVKNGYAVLPVAYADSLDVRLNTVVKRVAYRDDGCTVATQSTLVNTGEQEMECDAVLCTLPLGVLRPPNPELDHGPNVIFEPSLPDWKTQAIARLGFGNLNKVVMCFERAFWDTSAHLFGHVGATTSSRGELFLFWGIYRAPLLIALVAGQAANVLEHIGDGVVISRTVAVLRAIFGAENVPEPISYTVTRWGSDPWCRGSYSYVATGSSGHDYDVMASPVDAQGSAYEDVTANGKARLFFAGEHTMRNYPATVHGAFLSGVREAARIADIFLGPLLAAVDPSPPDDDVL